MQQSPEIPRTCKLYERCQDPNRSVVAYHATKNVVVVTISEALMRKILILRCVIQISALKFVYSSDTRGTRRMNRRRENVVVFLKRLIFLTAFLQPELRMSDSF